ncbi:hypothetical protein DXG03_000909 [Asterophora parasitica]|uniref:F-box domain-containing protein n=1 Tax=Asterophora parasitica TaxID=117018 RepID=A0A9P7G3H0_9AGAR|nr:hypothetical protein DXG03_000909 [Asterophora parasitica]
MLLDRLEELTSLPQELIIQIVGDVDADTGLEACSLVCRAWSLPAKAEFFRRVTLDTNVKCGRFHTLLLESPHIACLVRDLEVVTDHDPETILDDEASLTAVLLLLKHLKSFTLRLGWRMIWNDLSTNLHDAVIHVLKLPSLTSLEMENWYFDLADVDLHNLFIHGTALKRLSLLAPSCPTDGEPSEDQFLMEVPNRPRLDELIVGLEYGAFGIGEWLARSRCSLDLSGLRTLHVMHTANDDLISRILKVAGASLESFHLEVQESDG